MKQEDKNLLEGLFDSEHPQKNRFLCVSRHGHILCLLPLDIKHSLRALSLYQAQSFKAKSYIIFIRLALRVKAYFLLKTVDLGSYKADFKFLEDSQNVGFLLGNPQASHRRVVAYHCVGDVAYVSKLALDRYSSDTVKKEISDLAQIDQSLKGATKLIDNSDVSTDSFAYFTVKWMKGRSPMKKDYLSLVDLLASWIHSDQKVKLSELEVWSEVLGLMEKEADIKMVEELGNNEVYLSPIHGDFSPWNIKVSSKNEVSVLDWESYRKDGVSGWDWAHFLIQSKLLVDRMNPDEVLDSTILWARGTEGSTCLSKFGWSGDHLSWIGSYLFYAQYKLGYDRADLLECWKEKVETSS